MISDQKTLLPQIWEHKNRLEENVWHEGSHFEPNPFFFLIIVMLVLYIFSAEKGSLSKENTQISRV